MRPSRFVGALSVLGAVVAIDASAAPARETWTTKVDLAVLSSASAGPIEFMVYLSPRADLRPAYSLRTKEEKGRLVYARLTAAAREAQAPVLAQLTRAGAHARAFWIVDAIWATGDRRALAAVASLPQVAHVYGVGRWRIDRPAGSTGSDSTARKGGASTVEDNLTNVRAPQVWALGYRGQGVTVASADTGVSWTHPALQSKYRGWNGTAATHDYNWHDAITTPLALCPVAPSPEPCDDNSHGTHTTGTMVGGEGANEIGMAPDAKWIACRNMEAGVGTVPRYLDCMQWLMAPTKIDGTSPDPTKAPHVVNNSWGCPPSEGCPSQMLKDQLAATRAAGIFYAVSAGNSGPSCGTVSDSLGNYENAFTVGATDHRTEAIASFSSRGPAANDGAPRLKPNVVAPGVSIRSSVLGNAYGNKSGTSMASPHVAGLVALIISAKPSLAGNVPALEDLVEASSLDRTTTQGCGGDTSTQVPNNTFGWGRIDALAAIQSALGTTAVKLTSFTGARSRAGVELRWRTAAEVGVVGYVIGRASGAGYVRVSGVIPARVPTGGLYRFLDRSATRPRNYTYRLSALLPNRALRVLGSVRVSPR